MVDPQGPYYTNGTTHVLTTCFDDVILEPLGSWVFLLFTAVLFLVMLRRRTADPKYLGTLAVDGQSDGIGFRCRSQEELEGASAS